MSSASTDLKDRRAKVTDKVLATMRELESYGHTRTDIAKALSLSRITVYRHLGGVRAASALLRNASAEPEPIEDDTPGVWDLG